MAAIVGTSTICLLLGPLCGISPMRATKCLIPNNFDHISRALLLQQCLSKNYGEGNETQCYDSLGCFTMDYPWTSLLRPFPVPLHPAEVNVRLYCYIRDSQKRFNITLWPRIMLQGCPFSRSRMTAFITHGFASNGNASWVSQLKDIYLSAVNANVFVVDWGQGAQLLNYLQVASNTRIVGAELARFLNWLKVHKGLKASKLHLMGHSLGAHISAYAAKAMPNVYRLTALDPAQPGFEGTDKDCRLDKDDSDFVDVIHTNAAPFIPTLGFGLILPHGHVDIYMNGGARQPGCHVPDVTEIKGIEDLAKFPVETVNMWISCSHGRAYEFFKYSLLKNCTMWARHAGTVRNIINGLTLGYTEPLFSLRDKCDADSCLPIGIDTPNFKARGIFAATTSRYEPYCNTDEETSKKILQEIKATM